MTSFKQACKDKVIPKMMELFKYKNNIQVPQLKKIIINMGLSDANDNPKIIDHAFDDLSTITGQRPVITRAKKSISNFKVRKGMTVGCLVTLRGNRMYEFYNRLVNIVLPRVRDFRGLKPTSFDGRGNFSMGVKEQIIFPEIEYDKIDKIRGMDITIVTSANTDEEARQLLALMGMPFTKE